jgi:hypothetical protein
MASDRISCHSATANQVRLVPHTAAYWLMLAVRDPTTRGCGASARGQPAGSSMGSCTTLFRRWRASARPCDAGRRTVGAGDIQDSSRRACATACVFQAQWFAVERDCYRGYREAFDRNKSTRKTWLRALQSVRQFVWNLLSIACTPSNCNKSMAAGCEPRSSSKTGI